MAALTECRILIFVPMIKVLENGLTPVVPCCVPGMSCLIVGRGEYMFTSFTFKVACALKIKWVPLQLALPVVGVSVKSTHHEPKLEFSGTCAERAVLQCCREATADVIGTSDLPEYWAVNFEKPVDHGKGILHARFIIRLAE